MTEEFNELRWVLLEGPPLLFKTAKGWSAAHRYGPLLPARPIRAAAIWPAMFTAAHLMVDGLIPGVDNPAPESAVDPNLTNGGRFKSGAASPHDFRAPRLLDVHIIAGATKTPYGADSSYNQDALSVQLSKATLSTTENPKEINKARTFWTRALSPTLRLFRSRCQSRLCPCCGRPRPEPLDDQVGISPTRRATRSRRRTINGSKPEAATTFESRRSDLSRARSQWF